jgi:diadenosine tetraphosphate (Ap4A) HIT family hydrolase
MPKVCFFCDVQNRKGDDLKILDNNVFAARFSEFPVSKGHCEIFIKKHHDSFFDLSSEELSSFFEAIKQVKKIVDDKYHPDGYNIGINEGQAAGRSIDHLHVHLIPRYKDDVPNPRGGVRNIIPDKGDYVKEIKNNPDYKNNRKYVE